MKVYPAAGLINYVKPNKPKFLIDPNEVKSYKKVEFIKEKASRGIEILTERLLN